jgi:hypothetical protein
MLNNPIGVIRIAVDRQADRDTDRHRSIDGRPDRRIIGETDDGQIDGWMD